jgi:hypothetical protein
LNNGLITGNIEDHCRSDADGHENYRAHGVFPHIVFTSHLVSLPSDVCSCRFWQIDPGSAEPLAQFKRRGDICDSSAQRIILIALLTPVWIS